MLLVYLPRITPRAEYIFTLVFRDLIGCDFRLTASPEDFLGYEGPGLTYGQKPIDGRLFIEATGLLDETDVSPKKIIFTECRSLPAFFATGNSSSLFSFDLFSAAFYLVSRYEEYLPFNPDRFGRYRARESVAGKGDFLHLPVVNIWSNWLEEALKKHYPSLRTWPRQFSFFPTIDIDHAYAYRLRKLVRVLGGYGRAIMRGNWKQVVRRTQVLLGKAHDPYDTYAFLHEVHRLSGLSPLYFILLADYGGHDNNVTTDNREFQELLLDLDEKGTIGIHPSLSSNREYNLLEEELFGLSNLIGRDITMSRQHFLWLSFPRTYENLIRLGITDDYSMGYSTEPGFRASIADPFRFFDLEKNETMPLTIHPVSLMDVSLRDHYHLSRENAIKKCREVISTVRSVNGTFIPVWHNESLSESGRWKGWTWVYTEMLRFATGQYDEE
jgi:hypothetical protein